MRKWRPRRPAPARWSKRSANAVETRSQTAIRFGLSHPAVSTVVFGVAEMAHVHQALAAPGLGPLEEDALAALRRAWASEAFVA